MLTIGELLGSSVRFQEHRFTENCNLKFRRFCTEVRSKYFRFRDEIVQEYLKQKWGREGQLELLFFPILPSSTKVHEYFVEAGTHGQTCRYSHLVLYPCSETIPDEWLSELLLSLSAKRKPSVLLPTPAAPNWMRWPMEWLFLLPGGRNPNIYFCR